MKEKEYCPYCGGILRKVDGSDMTYWACDACEELVEPENPAPLTSQQISPEQELADRKMQIAINYHNEKARRANED